MRPLAIFLAIYPATLMADVVLLRDGSILKGNIEKMTKAGLVIVNFYGTFTINRKDFHKAYRTKNQNQDDKVKATIDSFRAKGDLISITTAIPDPVVVALEKDGQDVEEVRDFEKASAPKRKGVNPEAAVSGLAVAPLNVDLPAAPGVSLRGNLPVFRLLKKPLRAGLALTFSRHSTDTGSFNGAIIFVPILAFAEYGWPVGKGFVPYTRLGLGMSYVSFDRTFSDTSTFESEPQTKGNSMDMTLMAALGTYYRIRNLRRVSPFFEIGWVNILEETQSHFFHVALGIAYRPISSGFAR